MTSKSFIIIPLICSIFADEGDYVPEFDQRAKEEEMKQDDVSFFRFATPSARPSQETKMDVEAKEATQVPEDLQKSISQLQHDILPPPPQPKQNTGRLIPLEREATFVDDEYSECFPA